MDEQTRGVLKQIRTFLEEDHELKSYFGDTSSMSPSRFWSLLRSDLMRLRPSELTDYLTIGKTCLVEIGDFGSRLADKFFSSNSDSQQLRQNQDALIHACLEMDAAAKIKRLLGGDQMRAQKLSKKLELWRTP